jgi:chromosome segregation ATPase
MTDSFEEYRERHSTLKRELDELAKSQERIERKRIYLRKELKNLEIWLTSEGVHIEHSEEDLVVEPSTSLADDIRAILKIHYPRAMRPREIKAEIAELGRDLERYRNLQATVHMVLKRMSQSKSGGVTESRGPDGKQVYSYEPTRSMESKSDPRPLVEVHLKKKV